MEEDPGEHFTFQPLLEVGDAILFPVQLKDRTQILHKGTLTKQHIDGNEDLAEVYDEDFGFHHEIYGTMCYLNVDSISYETYVEHFKNTLEHRK